MSESLSSRSTFRRVFFFIIDAIRLDDLYHVPQSKQTNDFSGFKFMHSYLSTKPAHSALFGFRGDPPTVTSQRLKGITTGTLPTFMDISSNFNSAAVNDDNVIDQIRNRSKVLTGQNGDVSSAMKRFNSNEYFL
jgi:phosphatidylinositol glycan class O